MIKIREEFANTMLKVGSRDSKLVVMVGDISHSNLKPFAKKFPKRYYNIGICEPSMVNMAAGLKIAGLIPVVHTIAPFITERSFEQIKLDFGYQKLDFNLISVGGSFDYSRLGCSHHCYTDVSLLSHLKRSNIVIPGSGKEFNIIFRKIYKKKFINYFRLPARSHGINFKEKDIIFGKGIKILEGKDITICTIAPQLPEVIKAANALRKINISAEVLYFHTIKPFDKKLLRKSLKKTKKLITVEELSSHDGLYNICLKESRGINNFRSEQIAVKDFIHIYGSYEDLTKQAGLVSTNITKLAKKII